mgnify:CR=1 FL=1
MKKSDDTEVSEKGKPFSEEVKDVLAALHDLMTRTNAIAMLRAKDGRKIGVKATEALRAVQDDLQEAWTELDQFIDTVGTEGALELDLEDEQSEEILVVSPTKLSLNTVISLNAVSFSYPDGTSVLNNINIDIMIGFKVLTAKGVYSFPTGDKITDKSIIIDGTPIYLCSLKDWLEAYTAMERTKKIKLINQSKLVK